MGTLAQLDQLHERPDGRKLGYCCYGVPDGRAVVALHGTPGSRYKFAVADCEAKRLGLRLICPDRWGYGLSDVPRGRVGLADYASDVQGLLSELGVERFSVVGVSGGGPFAVALAAVFGPRVSNLALVAPVAPVDTAERRQGMSVFHQISFLGLPRMPGGTRLVFSCFRGVLAVSPRIAMRVLSARAGRVDRELLAEPEIAADLSRTFRAGLARGVAGPQIDMRLFSRDWQIDLSGVVSRTRMWLGDQDRNIPLAAARRLSAEIPGLELIETENSGHFWIVQNFAQVLSWLARESGEDNSTPASQPAASARTLSPPRTSNIA